MVADTTKLYRLISELPRHDHSTLSNLLPANGIYLFFEAGETIIIDGQRYDRIVRVGTHNRDGRFPKRIRQHYGARSSYNGNKNASVFRRHLGGALMRRDDPDDPRLPEWLRQKGARDLSLEVEVSSYIRENFTFVCFAVSGSEERLILEAGLIALLSQFPVGAPSAQWLGYHAAAWEIQQSGLWNTRHTNGMPLSAVLLKRISESVKFVR